MENELKAKIIVRVIASVLAFILFLVVWDGFLSFRMAKEGFCYQRTDITSSTTIFAWGKCK